MAAMDRAVPMVVDGDCIDGAWRIPIVSFSLHSLLWRTTELVGEAETPFAATMAVSGIAAISENRQLFLPSIPAVESSEHGRQYSLFSAGASSKQRR